MTRRSEGGGLKEGRGGLCGSGGLQWIGSRLDWNSPVSSVGHCSYCILYTGLIYSSCQVFVQCRGGLLSTGIYHGRFSGF